MFCRRLLAGIVRRKFKVQSGLLCARVHISIITLFECGLLIIIHDPYSYYVEENGERKKESIRLNKVGIKQP